MPCACLPVIAMMKLDTLPGNVHKEAVKVAAEKVEDLFFIDATTSKTLQGNALRLLDLGLQR